MSDRDRWIAMIRDRITLWDMATDHDEVATMTSLRALVLAELQHLLALLESLPPEDT